MGVKEKIPLVYQNIANIFSSYVSLPFEWMKLDLKSFSDNISLYDYQQEALKRAIELLFHYYEIIHKFVEGERNDSSIKRKKKYHKDIRLTNPELIDNLSIKRKNYPLLFNKLKEYYTIVEENGDEKVPFQFFVNRMSFWMATGSGKTIVLIKLVELLDQLKESKLIPNNDILILTQREDLIDQIKSHITEFNLTAKKKIKIWNLKEYDRAKRFLIPLHKEKINVFIYRSDLITDETKDKQLGFEDIENNGNWYVLLDEAHKGVAEDSKRQLYFSIFTRNGFLFNFSATYTDPWDIVTTIYNFNLDSYIRKGYGKNVFLSQQAINIFKNLDEINERERQKIILKSFFLLTIIQNSKKSIDKSGRSFYYHNPLLISLMHTVNPKDSDLITYFQQVANFSKGNIEEDLFEEIKEDLIEEFSRDKEYIFGNEILRIHEATIRNIEIKDILLNVFNASSFGNVEVIKIPQNKEELIFKLKTSELPFALTKIGDISDFLKNLHNYEINESYDNESYFERLKEDTNSINILMGSRAFYEGWDSNRPNVMIFINIGSERAKKYVTQSIGRGVRIEPIKHKRKRLIHLTRLQDREAKDLFKKIRRDDITLIESLFIFGTRKKSLETILENIIYESESTGEIVELEKNIETKTKTLLIPTYTVKNESLKVEELPKFKANKEFLIKFIEWLDDERLVLGLFSHNHFLTPATIKRAEEYLVNGSFEQTQSEDVLSDFSHLLEHININLHDLDRFVELSNEIIHFKNIRITLEKKKIQELKKLINKVKSYKDPSIIKEELQREFNSRNITLEEYTEGIELLNKMSDKEKFRVDSSSLSIRHIINHYYLPIIISEEEKADYINHIISIESEKQFIEQLGDYIQKEGNFLGYFDWWMFSKIDEYLDEVFIPYYNRKNLRIEKFKPDFIFWLQKEDKYYILFIDPKGITYADYQYKVDGYRIIFENDGIKRNFLTEGVNIQVHLFLFTKDKNKVSTGYREYWFDSFDQILSKIMNSIKTTKDDLIGS